MVKIVVLWNLYFMVLICDCTLSSRQAVWRILLPDKHAVCRGIRGCEECFERPEIRKGKGVKPSFGDSTPSRSYRFVVHLRFEREDGLRRSGDLQFQIRGGEEHGLAQYGLGGERREQSGDRLCSRYCGHRLGREGKGVRTFLTILSLRGIYVK